MRRRPAQVAAVLVVTLVGAAPSPHAIRPHGAVAPGAADTVVPNDNRVAAGRARAGVRRIALVAGFARWRPDASVDSFVTVRAFAEAGGPPRVPGPLVRVTSGTRVQLALRHDAGDSVLVVRGLRAGTVAVDTVQLRPGETRELEFVAGAPGTYLYWGTLAGVVRLQDRKGPDTQLTGAIVVDAPGAGRDTGERVMVLTLIGVDPDSTGGRARLWEVAINGRSWPHTERLRYLVGDTVRWRIANGTDRSHPMHLHGFHFRVTAKGDGRADTLYSADRTRLAVTEFLPAGATAAIDWLPVRAGNWLFHCHMTAHITPFPRREASRRHGDAHEVARHPAEAMAGMVLGISAIDRHAAPAPVLASAGPRFRLLVQERRVGDTLMQRAFVLQRGADPAADSIESPSSTIEVRRGEPTRITVVNRLGEPTTVHWHGLELESVYDGVSGWSGDGRHRAPLLAPGDSFTVTLTPPRAGTFMYHTHMDEGEQLATGLAGMLLVVEPGTRVDPSTDHTFLVARGIDGGTPGFVLNGTRSARPVVMRAGETHRFRIAHLRPNGPMLALLTAGADTLRWRPVAKDGADLPAALRGLRPAVQVVGVGEAYDYEFTPGRAMTAVLQFRLAPGPAAPVLRQEIVVRE